MLTSWEVNALGSHRGPEAGTALNQRPGGRRSAAAPVVQAPLFAVPGTTWGLLLSA